MIPAPKRKTQVPPPARKKITLDGGSVEVPKCHRAWYEAMSRLTGFGADEIYRLHYPHEHPLPEPKRAKVSDACQRIGGYQNILAELRHG